MRRMDSRPAGLTISLIAAIGLAACNSGDHAPPEIMVDADELTGIAYQQFALGTIPQSHLSVIGEASGDPGHLVGDMTAYAITGIEPDQYLALAIDPDEYEAYVAEVLAPEGVILPSLPPTHQVFVAAQAEPSHLEALCAYFDPLADLTPEECRAPITISVEGHTYRALGWFGGKSLAAGFAFFPSDLEAAGTLADVDPRVSAGPPLDPQAYSVRGIPASDLVVVAVGSGLSLQHYAFIAEDVSIPEALCDFVGRHPVDAGVCGEQRNAEMAAMEEAMIEHEELWFMAEAQTYRFTISVRCDCPAAARGPFTVTVVGSDIVDQVSQGAEVIPLDDPRLAWTPLRVNEAFDAVIRYAPATTHQVEFHPDYGIPLRLDADPAPAVDGDEYSFTIIDFEILEPS